jgi:short subunit dehydrogenase-like uncharacterized protein
MGEELGLEHRVFALDVPSTIDACLDGVGVVLHCAGPFSRTAVPMAEACLRNKAHYLDVTGEVEVFERLAKRSDEAKQANIMLMPGVGFDVVPSDCLAAHVAARCADATTLRIAIMGVGAAMSHGTATTMVENLHRGSLVRREGALVKVHPGSLTRTFDFGRGPKLAMALPWGDLTTAWHSTGIGTIETYFAMGRRTVWGARVAGLVPWLVGSKPVQGYLKRRVDARPAGPTAEQRARASSILVAEVENAAGQRVASRLVTPNGYSLTADAGVEIARRVLGGEWRSGFQTPSMVYGADFILTLPGTSRVDIAT